MVSCVVFLVFGVEMLFGLMPFKACPLFAFVFVVLFFVSLVVGVFVGDVFLFFFFSLSLSLSQALGKPKPLLGFGFPLVFLHPGRGLRLRPVRLHFLLHQGHAQPLLVFFLLVGIVVFLVWVFSVCSGWVVFLGGWLSGGGFLHALGDSINASVGRGRRTRHPSPP